MMRRVDDSELTLEFDLDAGELDEANEISLDHPGAHRRGLVAFGLGVVLVVATVVVGRSGPAPDRSRTVPSTVAAPAPVVPTGVTVLLSDGSATTTRFDADRARSSAGVTSWDPGVAAFGGTSIPLVDGTRWVIAADRLPGAPFVLDRRSADGATVDHRVPAAGSGLDLAGDVRLIGVTADEQPIIGDLGRHTFVVAADGSISPFSDGLIETVVDHGRYAENRCGSWCRIAIHGTNSRLSVGSLGLLLVTAFNPAGDLVALMDYTAEGTMVVRLLDLRHGEEIARTTHRHLAISGPWLPGWSGGGELFSFVADDRLVVIDARTGEVRQIDGPTGGFGLLQVAGVLEAPR